MTAAWEMRNPLIMRMARIDLFIISEFKNDKDRQNLRKEQG
jgi:hypothetical protein